MADAQDLKSCVTLVACGFESHPRHMEVGNSGGTRVPPLAPGCSSVGRVRGLGP